MSDSKEPKDKDPKDPGDMSDVMASMREIMRVEVRQRAARAAKKRGFELDPNKLVDPELERWELVAVEDAIEEERAATMSEAAKRQAELAGSLRGLLPEEFQWVDPRAPKLMHERVADAKVVLAAARAAADAIVVGDVKRVLIVGPAGSGKTSLAALIPQVMAARWAKDRFERETKGIDARPASEIAAERVRARRETERDLDTPPTRPGLIPRRQDGYVEPAASTPAAKTLAKVSRGGKLAATWATAHELFRLARKPIAFREVDPLDEYRETPILVLDDIGGEPEQANVAPVEDVIRERHDAQRITIATTGMIDLDADTRDLDKLLAPLSARYGAAVVRRLAEKGRSIVIQVGIAAAQAARRAA